MDISLIFRIAMIGIVVSILAIILTQSKREEMAQMLTLVGVAVVLTIVIKVVVDLFDTVRTMFQL